MRKFDFGAAALAGALLLFIGWLADQQQRAAVERIERWEAPHEAR